MSSDQNKTLAATIYGEFTNRDYDAVLNKVTDDVEVVFHATGQRFHGKDGFRDFMQGFKTAMPDCSIQIVDQVGTDDGVVNQVTARGTHTGPLLTPAGEIPATGRGAEWPVCEVWKIRDGKLARIDNYQDLSTMLRQLGLVPEPAGV